MRRPPLAQRLLPAEMVLEGLGRLGEDARLRDVLLRLGQEPTAADALGDDEERHQGDEHRQRALDDE